MCKHCSSLYNYTRSDHSYLSKNNCCLDLIVIIILNWQYARIMNL